MWNRLLVLLVLCVNMPGLAAIPPSQNFVVIGWNDLGMHCMNFSYSDLCVLPPYNNLWAQVIRRNDPPRLVTLGVQVEYSFPANTTSADKINFWQYEDKLFNVNLATNIGLTGKGLAGFLTRDSTFFEAAGVPLTPFDDASPTVEQPYQLATLTAKRKSDGAVLDQTQIVAPVSIEMNCAKCHEESGDSTEVAILKEHDDEENTDLMNSRPVLCANCHASNALGLPGKPGIPNLSRAVHHKHADEADNISCYDCHPGANTQCLRDAMFIAGRSCEDCHGNLSEVANSIQRGRRPWLDEPRCGTCHPDHPENDNTLYRLSKGHGGLYCAACHNSPHAILPTVQARDGLQMTRLQGHATSLSDCRVCHLSVPTGPGPHGLLAQNSVGRGLWQKLE